MPELVDKESNVEKGKTVIDAVSIDNIDTWDVDASGFDQTFLKTLTQEEINELVTYIRDEKLSACTAKQEQIEGELSSCETTEASLDSNYRNASNRDDWDEVERLADLRSANAEKSRLLLIEKSKYVQLFGNLTALEYQLAGEESRRLGEGVAANRAALYEAQAELAATTKSAEDLDRDLALHNAEVHGVLHQGRAALLEADDLERQALEDLEDSGVGDA